MPSNRRCALEDKHACNPVPLLGFIHLTTHLSRCSPVYVCRAEYNRARIDLCPHISGRNKEKNIFFLLFWLEDGIMHGYYLSELQLITLEWWAGLSSSLILVFFPYSGSVVNPVTWEFVLKFAVVSSRVEEMLRDLIQIHDEIWVQWEQLVPHRSKLLPWL